MKLPPLPQSQSPLGAYSAFPDAHAVVLVALALGQGHVDLVWHDNRTQTGLNWEKKGAFRICNEETRRHTKNSF